MVEFAEWHDTVSGVAIYPLKSAAAATVQGTTPRSLPIGKTGFEVNGVCDRDFVLFDPNTESMVSQRGWGAWPSKLVKYAGDRVLSTVDIDVQNDHIFVSSN